jgi:hypothetical protein
VNKFFILLITILLITCVASLSWPQQLSHRLTNQDIIDMTALGLSDEVIITKIRSATKPEDLAFDTSTAGLRALKAGRVSDEVIKVMINPATATLPTPPAAAPAPATVAPPPAVVAPNPAAANVGTDPNLPPAEVGVYWKDGYTFQRVEGQIVSQAKVGGRAGSMFSYGMRSEHWDAYVNGTTSRNRVSERRPLFYFYVPDGASAADFILLKLEKKGNRREFQIGSFGGVTGGKSGVKRDKEVPFKADHVAVRTYRIALDEDLKPGEYGFFMGTGQQSMMASGRGGSHSGGAASGRIYDFTVPD